MPLRLSAARRMPVLGDRRTFAERERRDQQDLAAFVLDDVHRNDRIALSRVIALTPRATRPIGRTSFSLKWTAMPCVERE